MLRKFGLYENVLREGEGVGAAGAGAGAGAAGNGAGTPWFQGKLEGELLGHVQTLGWDKKPAEEAVIEAVKAHYEARKHIGVPEDRLIRLPKDQHDEAGWRGVWNKLGAPTKAEEYDFSGVKFADGSALEPAFETAIREAAFKNAIPKERAAAFAKAFVDYQDNAEKAELAAKSATIEAERLALKKEWGGDKDFDAHRFIAQQGAKALGLAPEDVEAMEKAGVPYTRIMKALHKAGELNKEDGYIAGGAGGGVLTAEGAQARAAELMAEVAAGTRNMQDPRTMKELFDLNQRALGIYDPKGYQAA